MKRINNLWPQLIAFDNIWNAFRKAIRGKGLMPCAMRFTENLESNLLQLRDELAAQIYLPGNYCTFFVHEPKRRMISAAPFRDRVVHHCLINVLEPIYEKIFIDGSYANRKSKGVHQAIRDVQSAMRLNRFILHCDICKYFPSIDHHILKGLLRRKIKDENILWLADLIIDSSNEQEEVLHYFPSDDLLTPIERRRGLPIGNLTSQFFANLYLDGLDHFIKEKLHCRYYFRYVDDLFLLHYDRRFLKTICQEIEAYAGSLRLRLHPGKKHIRPVNTGERFLGQIVFPNRRLLPKKNIRRFMKRMHQMQQEYGRGEIGFAQMNHSVQSWLGHAKQANTWALRSELFDRLIFVRDSPGIPEDNAF